MRALLILFIFFAYTLGSGWYFFCQIRGNCLFPITTDVDVPRLKTLELREKERVILSGFDQFYFDTAVVRPLMNENNEIFLDSVAAFLKQNEDKSLEITSFYRPSEQDSTFSYSFYDNIGVARAAFVRTALRRRDISEDRIGLDYGFNDSDTLTEPLSFTIYPIAENNTQLRFTFSNIDFSDANFEFNSDIFEPTRAFMNYADSLESYLAANPEKKLLITGHTDAIGAPSYNENLGKRRALNTKKYLLEQYDIQNTVDTKSEGEKIPLVPNTTEANRRKNRRVQIQIQ